MMDFFTEPTDPIEAAVKMGVPLLQQIILQCYGIKIKDPTKLEPAVRRIIAEYERASGIYKY